MSENLCIDCARAEGMAPTLPASGTADTTYQLEKFMKHAVSGMTENLNSLFSDPHRVNDCTVNALCSGYLEIDDAGRKSWNILADQETGVTFMSGQFVGSCNAVKVVCWEYSGKMHAYPFIAGPATRKCSKCGRALP
jgi:hypothetical protein